MWAPLETQAVEVVINVGSYLWDIVFCAFRLHQVQATNAESAAAQAFNFPRLLHQQQSLHHPKHTQAIPHLFKQRHIFQVKWSWMHDDPGKLHIRLVHPAQHSWVVQSEEILW